MTKGSEELKRYPTLDAVQAVYRHGWAVQHDCYPLLAEQVDARDRFYYTWHNSEKRAHDELKRHGFSGESAIIPITETATWRQVRDTMEGLRRARRRSQSPTSGRRRKGQSFFSV